jgi:RNA recognition motif-containing protein
VSIGKNRKVYPKDLVGLFCSTLGIDSQSLGSVKVLDNYSFVDIPTPYAQKAIDELDGKDYRGRKITVNFARKREEKEQS